MPTTEEIKDLTNVPAQDPASQDDFGNQESPVSYLKQAYDGLPIT